MASGTQIFREVNNASDSLLKWLDDRNQLYPITDPKGGEHYFIDNDQPRDADINEEIITVTTGFALFTEQGEYIGSYRSLDRAIRAQQSAKVVVNTEVEDAEPDENVEEDFG